MKRSYVRYKRYNTFSAKGCTCFVIIAEIIVVLVCGLLCNGDYYWWIMLDISFAIAFFWMWLPLFGMAKAEYSFLEDHILFSHMGFFKAKKRYYKFDFIVISNAAFGTKGSGAGLTLVTEKNELGISVVLPYLSMHKKGYDTRNLCKNKTKEIEPTWRMED